MTKSPIRHSCFVILSSLDIGHSTFVIGEGMSDLIEQIVTRPEDLAEICAHLSASRRFGFDTEFVGENTYHPHLCLVQVATAERVILIDPLTVGPLDAFWKLVVDPTNEVVVHAGREEVRLCRLWTGLTPGNLIDLQLAAGLVGLTYPLGHGALVSQVFRVQLTKGETLTEWRERPLTRAQIRYAYDDVRYLLPLWERLGADLHKRGRDEWLREEVTRLTNNAAPDVPSPERWRKLRGLGALDRRRLTTVRELYAWREAKAAATNRPARTIIRDDLIIEIARRNPQRVRDLQVVRGLARRDLDAILEVVGRAAQLPREQWAEPTERELDAPQIGWLAGVLTAVLGDFCVRQRLAPNLVATSQDIKLLVRSRLAGDPLPLDSLLTKGWRARHVLPELLAVLDGRRSLRVADVRADAPFTFEDKNDDCIKVQVPSSE
jgi:ribonuclease D